MRWASGVVLASSCVVVACVHDGIKLQRDACGRSDNADPDACLAVARERFGANDRDAAVEYLEKQIATFQADGACFAHHPVATCFHGVVAVLREPAVGLLADYAIEPELLKALPPWTGSDATGPHAQARTALESLCKQAGDPVAQQRACLVLGDLVTLEKSKLIAGYEDAMDGYAAACKVVHGSDVAWGELAQQVRQIYGVSGDDPVCAVASSAQHGASIFGGAALVARMRDEAAQREAAAADAAKREAARVAAVKEREAEAAAKAAREAAATSSKQIVSAASAEDWELLLETLRTRPGMGALEPAAADALARAWEVFTAWLVSQSTLVGAELELARDLRDAVPPGHALARSLNALRDRALDDAKKLAKKAGGPGGRFLHAALIAQVAANDSAADAAARGAYVELQKAVRARLVLDTLAPSCSALVKTPAPPGQAVHATAQLVCSIEPEHTWSIQEAYMVNGKSTPTDVEHRGYKLVIHGTVAANGNTIKLDFDTVVDETTDKLEVPYAVALGRIVDALWNEIVAPLDAKTAADALAAGQKAAAQKNTKRAENELVIHALLAGSSEELDQLLAPYHVTFGQLVPAT